jgi:arylsulfatase A-like enzyme
MRPLVLLATVALAGCAPPSDVPGTLAVPTTPSGAADPPHVVLVLVDDLGATDLGGHGSDLHLTPRIDALTTAGVRFTNAYAAAAVCSPTRAAIVTGQHPARLQVTDWIPGRGDDGELLREARWQPYLPDDVPTLGDVLSAHGYHTAWHGKWHLDGQPTDHGFHEGFQDWSLMTGQRPDDPKGVLEVTADALATFDAATGPVFVAVSHHSVHTPLRTRPEQVEAVRQRMAARGPGVHDHPRYAAMVEDLDASVGVLLDGLALRGVLEDTVVIVTSDNGGLARITTNIGLRSGKGSLYEGGLRVPLVVWSPEVVPHDSPVVTSSEDLLPTIAAITGAPLPGPVDGRSLLPVLQGEALPDRPVQAHYPHHNTNPEAFPGGSFRDEDGFKLVERFGSSGSTFELYDLHSDRAENFDLAAERPEQVAALRERLAAWRLAVGAQEMSSSDPLP